MAGRCRLAVVATLAIVLNGCAVLDLRPPGTSATTTASTVGSASDTSNAAVPSVEPGAVRTAGVIAGQEVHSDGARLRVDITGLTREGRLITLDWNITMLQQNAEENWSLSTKLSAHPAGTSVSDYDVSGVTLVDPVNAKRYLVARSGGNGEEEGDCVCSNSGGGRLAAGESASYFATFTAPPPEVTKVDVQLAQLGAINGVPIS
jgi:hypothetical protein